MTALLSNRTLAMVVLDRTIDPGALGIRRRCTRCGAVFFTSPYHVPARSTQGWRWSR